MNEITILVLIRRYVPAFKSGGPVRTLENIINRLGGKINFRVICTDRDSGDKESFQNIQIEKWQQVGNAKVYYCGKKYKNPFLLKRLIQSSEFDVYYLNSFWDPVFTITPLLLLKLKSIPQRPVLIAPRGELYEDALRNRIFKKKLILKLGRCLGLWNSLSWHFSSEQEAMGFKNLSPTKQHNRLFILEDLSVGINSENVRTIPKKQTGSLKVCYVGRIHPHKNLLYLIEILQHIEYGNVVLNVYGLIDHKSYWEKCRALINRLHDNVAVIYHGPVTHQDIPHVFKSNHISCLPSRSENFGHSIRESIMNGCPVLIGNNTPWQDLENKGIGYNFELSEREAFIDVFQSFIQLNQSEYNSVRSNVIKSAKKIANKDAILVKKHEEMFNSLLEK